jgi:hypothetical protein
MCQGAHGLHALYVLSGFSFLTAIGDVPILRGDNGHIAHLKHHVHRLVGDIGATTAAYTDIGYRLVSESVTIAVEKPLNEGHGCGIGNTIVDRSSEDEGISVHSLSGYLIGDVIVESASVLLGMRLTPSTSDATTNGFGSDFHQLRLYAIFL